MVSFIPRGSDPVTGLPPGSTNRALASPQGPSRTVTDPPAADLPESLTVAQLALRFEEIDGDFSIAVKPMDFELAVVHVAVKATPPVPKCPTRWIDEASAEDPGIANRLAIRPDDPA